jgi:hypothetical protein
MPNQRYPINGNNKIPHYDSEIDVDVDDTYEAYSKPIPDNPTPIPGGGGDITWFNNFGVREKSTKNRADVPYTVFLHPLPPKKRLFVFYDNAAHEIFPEDGGNGRIKFSLSVGDPPTGMGP